MKKLIIQEDMSEKIKKLIIHLELLKQRVLKYHHLSHYIDLNYKTWDNSVDGLDYSIHKLKKLMGYKK